MADGYYNIMEVVYKDQDIVWFGYPDMWDKTKWGCCVDPDDVVKKERESCER